MGTKMAPSYASLSVGKFEQEALAADPHSPLIWWRYIGDIFLLWTHGEDKLNDFLNSLHPAIKFTSSFSYSESLSEFSLQLFLWESLGLVQPKVEGPEE